MIKSRRLRWAGHVSRIEEGRSVFKILRMLPTGKRPLRRLSYRWEDNIRMDLKEVGAFSYLYFITFSGYKLLCWQCCFLQYASTSD